MTVEIDIRYSTVPLIYSKRYELSLMAYDDWLNRCYDWSMISFTAKPTSRQIRSEKKRFYLSLSNRSYITSLKIPEVQ